MVNEFSNYSSEGGKEWKEETGNITHGVHIHFFHIRIHREHQAAEGGTWDGFGSCGKAEKRTGFSSCPLTSVAGSLSSLSEWAARRQFWTCARARGLGALKKERLTVWKRRRFPRPRTIRTNSNRDTNIEFALLSTWPRCPYYGLIFFLLNKHSQCG